MFLPQASCADEALIAEVRRDLAQRLGLSAAAVTNITCTEVVPPPPPPPSPAPSPAPGPAPPPPPSPQALAYPSSQQRALLATPDPSVLVDLGVLGPHAHSDQQQLNRHQHDQNHNHEQQHRVLQASAATAAGAGGQSTSDTAASSSRRLGSGALPGCTQGRPPSITMDVSVRLPADGASTLAISGNSNGVYGYSGTNSNSGPGQGGLAGHVLSGLAAWQQEAAAAASSAMEVCLPAVDQIATSTQVRQCAMLQLRND